MEVQGSNGADPFATRQRYSAAQRDLLAAQLEHAKELRGDALTAPRPASTDEKTAEAENGHRDQLQLSSAQEAHDDARAERVGELRAQFRAGTLNTPERIERAAEGLLGD